MAFDPVSNTAQPAYQSGRSAQYGPIQSGAVSNPARPMPMMGQGPGVGSASPAVGGVPPGPVTQGAQPQGAFASMPGMMPGAETTSLAALMEDPTLMMGQDQQSGAEGAFMAGPGPAGGTIAPPSTASRSSLGSGAFALPSGIRKGGAGSRGGIV